MLKRERKEKQRERKRKRLRKTVKGNHERKSEVNGSERSLDGGGFSGWYVSVASRSRVFFSRPRVVLCLLTVCAREPAKVVPLLINCVIFVQLLSRARVPFRRGLSSSSTTPSSFLFLFLSGTSQCLRWGSIFSAGAVSFRFIFIRPLLCFVEGRDATPRITCGAR